MVDSGDIREDIKVPDGDLGNEIRTRFEGNEDMLVSVKDFYLILEQPFENIV